MGLKKNGAPDTIFNPNNFITRAQFGTMLSRLLYDGAYNVPLDSKSLWYQEHLEALQENNIMTKISSPMTRKEIKGWIILMMYRIANK
ncbi:S-layer homology domain-containing protein [Patescibacteria group bacterium]|nr:S-layer homology domain-containing protein [Patescibacteria group bacterium]MBU1758119.1 S-layer homology domain-containing protein [Patescibacteria group bacterium]